MKTIRIYDLIDLKPGNLAVTDIRLEGWGSTLIFECIYRYPPVEKEFLLIFDDVRGIHWNVQKTAIEVRDFDEAQMLTHDLGAPEYQHTARIATTLAEVILSYRKLKIERAW